MERTEENKVVPSNLAVVIGPSLRYRENHCKIQTNSNHRSWWPSGTVKKKDFHESMNKLIEVMRYILTNITSSDL